MTAMTAQEAHEAARRRGYVRRAPGAVLAFLLIVAAALTPHVMVEAAIGVVGRSLIPASRFFMTAVPDAPGFAGSVDPIAVGNGLWLTYLGLALQQVGSMLGIGTFWVLIAEDVGRWVRRAAFAGGIFLLLSAATVVLGYQVLLSAGIPTSLGIAWLPVLLAGLILIIGAQIAKRRLVSTWFLETPDLVQP